ncbi:MAG: two-component sensor histidine kinase [Myxococcaceae bacterium]|nr:two-component sensor histidine kinase [Myxococcaceae bacterium]
MALAIGSRSHEARRPRARLWMVFAAVGLGAFVLALLGLSLVRVYDDQLIRHTEGELIAQGAVVAEVYRSLLLAQGAGEAYGLARSSPWPFPVPSDTRLRPVLPSLRAASEWLPPVAEAPLAFIPAEPRAQQAGKRLSPLLAEAARATLAGIRVVDLQGVVVASSAAGVGTTLAAREEVRRALSGEPNSLLRQRHSDSEDAPLASLSRNTGVRVVVALPVLEGERVWGAVVLSRTPMTFTKALYGDRWNLFTTGLVLLGAVALMSLVAAALVVRPVRALVRQTRAIAASAPAGFEPVKHPVVQELAELSQALAGMATALRDRNQYIRSFAANVSHEFKTPLASIQGAVELLRDSAERMSPEQRERFLSNIDTDTRRLTRLVQRLLELSSADTLAATPAQVKLAPLLASLVERARAEQLAVEGAAVPDGLGLALPEELLEAVLWQLISNARQHGGEGVRVRLAVEVLEGGRRARVIVRDDGKGISEFNRQRIFDAFFTTARDRGGTGMGLTIAQAMVRAFGASLELLPAEGTGAAFAVVAETAPALPAQRK